MFSSNNSSIMDSEVVEIVPPINRDSTSRSLEQKEVNFWALFFCFSHEHLGDQMLNVNCDGRCLSS